MRSLSLVVLAALGCSSPASPDDAGRDAPRTDAARPPDAGFDPAALAPCELDRTLAADLTVLAAYGRLAAEARDDRLFYAFVVLDDDGTAEDLPAITAARRTALGTAAGCAGNDDCVRASIQWTDGDATAAGTAVRVALEGAGTLAAVATHFRGAGICALDEGSDAALVEDCVARTLREGTAALETVLGELDDPTLDAVVDAAAASPTPPFWGPLTHVVGPGLEAADRDEAVRYEPLADENAEAIALLATVDFADYPFAAIVIPGQGPGDDAPIHPNSILRADYGFDRWSAGLAPVLVLSGGHVHPDRTAYSEAIEMRRYLLEERGMPASAILVDPYARHTTTNLRNATRILARAGVPGDVPVLVTTDLLQAAYIRSITFDERNDDELGYRPYVALTRLSELDACFFLTPLSMHVALTDPLDP